MCLPLHCSWEEFLSALSEWLESDESSVNSDAGLMSSAKKRRPNEVSSLGGASRSRMLRVQETASTESLASIQRRLASASLIAVDGTFMLCMVRTFVQCSSSNSNLPRTLKLFAHAWCAS